jgi:hypothetical protein
MRHFLTVVLVAALVWLGWKFSHYFKAKIGDDNAPRENANAPAPGKMRGLPASLEPSLAEAKRGGPEGLRQWLRQHANDVQDPRLTDIELDYVVLVGRSTPAEARRVLDDIKGRIAKTSPAYKRFEQLDKAYQ